MGLLDQAYKSQGKTYTPTSTSSGGLLQQAKQATQIKPTTVKSTPIKIAPNATNISQKPNLFDTAVNAVKKIGKDITMSFTPPKVSPRLPDSAFQQQKIEPQKPISIKPNQKKLTTTQLSTVTGKVVNKIANAEQSIFGIKLGTIGKNLSELGKVLSGNTLPGMAEEYDKLDPWSKLNEASKIMGMFPTMQGFKQIEGAKDAMSAIRGFIGGYGAGSVLKFAAQEPKKRSVLEAIKPSFDNLVFAYFIGSTGLPNPFEFLKKQPAISKAEYIKSRDFLKEMGVKEDVFSKPEALKKSYFNLARKYHPDLPNGNATIFKKINNAYKIVSETFYDIAKTGDKQNIAGLLGDGEKTPQEIINKVIEKGIEKTPEGKALIKTSLEAQKQGKNVVIEKFPQPPVEGGEISKAQLEYKKWSTKLSEAYNNEDTKAFNLAKEQLGIVTKKLKELRNPSLSSVVEGGVKEGGKTTPMVSPTVKKVSGGEAGKGVVKPQKVSPKAKVVSVPREQLPVGTGEEAVSKLQTRVIESLKNLTDEQIKQLGGETYDKMRNKDTIHKASEYVLKNPEDAIKVLNGEIQAPKDLPINSIYVAMVNNSVGNYKLGTQLSTLRSTRFGQELEILKEIDPNSPVKLGSEIYKIQEETFKRKYGNRTIEEVSNKIAEKEVKKIRPPKLTDWGSIIKKVRC